MRLDGVDDFVVLVVLPADIYADLYVRAFDLGSQRLTDVVEQAGARRARFGVYAQLRRQNAAELGHFDGVHQHILPIAGAVIQPSQQLYQFVVQTVYIGLQNGTFALLADAVFPASRRAFSTISSILVGWILPSAISFSSAIRATSRRT